MWLNAPPAVPKPKKLFAQAVLRRKPEWQKRLCDDISKHASLPTKARFCTSRYHSSYPFLSLGQAVLRHKP